MNKYEALTSYIPKLNTGDFGEWIEDKVNDGTPERPKGDTYACKENECTGKFDEVNTV